MVIEFLIIDVSKVGISVIVLVYVNDDGVTISMLFILFEDKCTDKLTVLSISRERIVDVAVFIVEPVSMDDWTDDDKVKLAVNEDVEWTFAEVVNTVDKLGTFSKVVNIWSLSDVTDDCSCDCVGVSVNEYVSCGDKFVVVSSVFLFE